MSEIRRIESGRRYSRAVVCNGLVFLGGQTADDLSAGIEVQTRQTLAKVDRYLAEAGTDKSRVLSAQIWLKDIARDFTGMNEIWDAWVDQDAAPARATAQCEMAAPGVLLEITVVAAARP